MGPRRGERENLEKESGGRAVPVYSSSLMRRGGNRALLTTKVKKKRRMSCEKNGSYIGIKL